MLSLSELLPLLEDKIGFKVDEAYLEDSAVRLLKQAYSSTTCSCLPYKYIFLDLDDPTIMVSRFANNVNLVVTENKGTIKIFGTTAKETDKMISTCKKHNIEILKKPIGVD